MVPAHAGGCAASLKLDLARVARRRSARRDRHSPADAGAAGIGGLHDNVAAGGGVALAADHLDVPAARRGGRAGVDEDVAALVGGGVGAVGGPGLHDHVAAVAAVQVAAAGAAAGLDAHLATTAAGATGGEVRIEAGSGTSSSDLDGGDGGDVVVKAGAAYGTNSTSDEGGNVLIDAGAA